MNRLPTVFTFSRSDFFQQFAVIVCKVVIQRRGIEAVVSYWNATANNPVSSVYGGPMIGLAAVWTWDARPYPAWPSRTDAWGDGDLWPLGHWLNGKIGLADLAASSALKRHCNSALWLQALRLEYAATSTIAQFRLK